MTQKLDPLQVQERAHEAQSIIDSPVFKEAHLALRKQYFNDLLQAPVYDLTARQAHARLRALEDVIGQLKSFVTEDKMAKRR
jgi:hypothetical protein